MILFPCFLSEAHPSLMLQVQSHLFLFYLPLKWTCSEAKKTSEKCKFSCDKNLAASVKVSLCGKITKHSGKWLEKLHLWKTKFVNLTDFKHTSQIWIHDCFNDQERLSVRKSQTVPYKTTLCSRVRNEYFSCTAQFLDVSNPTGIASPLLVLINLENYSLYQIYGVDPKLSSPIPIVTVNDATWQNCYFSCFLKTKNYTHLP